MIPRNIIPLLAADAQIIARGYLDSGAPGQTNPRFEPDFVAALVIGAMPDIALAWGAILQPLGFNIRLQTVFCHGQPMVEFSPTGNHVYPIKTVGGRTAARCELADLLLVIDDATGDPHGNIIQSRRASLVQAKMLSSATATHLSLRGNDFAQLDLLESWPDFEFISPGYANRVRDFRTGYPTGVPIAGGSYGIINKYQSPPDWEHNKPILPIQAGIQSFGAFFAGLADSGTTATGRTATVGAADDWSFTIDELLSVTGVNRLNLASMKAVATSNRKVSHMAYYQSAMHGTQPGLLGSVMSQGFGEGGGLSDDRETRDGEGGISAIRIILSKKQE